MVEEYEPEIAGHLHVDSAGNRAYHTTYRVTLGYSVLAPADSATVPPVTYRYLVQYMLA